MRYLHVVASVVVAALAEQPVRHDAVDIELVKHRIRVLTTPIRHGDKIDCNIGTNLAQTCCEHHHFVDLAHLLEEVVHARSLDDIHIVPVVFNLNGDNVVRLLYRLYAMLGCAWVYEGA